MISSKERRLVSTGSLLVLGLLEGILWGRYNHFAISNLPKDLRVLGTLSKFTIRQDRNMTQMRHI